MGGSYKAAWKTEHFLLHDENRSGEQDAMKEVSGTGNDENHSGEQDAMKEVSGTGKGLLRFVEHTVDKAAKGAYKAAWKTEHFLLHDENRSGEQDAMKEVSGTGNDENRSGEQDAMKEVSGTGKGLLRFV